MKTQEKNSQAGFTLIEYIIALVIAAIVAAMIYSYMGSALIRSSDPIFRLQSVSKFHQVMENIVADHSRLNALNLRYKWHASTPYSVGTIITPKTIPVSPNGGYYFKCTTAGTSGTTEPTTWSSATTITDNTVTWTRGANIIWQKSNPYTLGAIVIPIYNNGHYYKCTAKAGTGTSGSTEPVWPTTTVGATVIDGTSPHQITWTEAGTILDRNTGLTDTILLDSVKYYLDTYLTTNVGRYGTGYTVVSAETKFIQFAGTPPTQVDAGASGSSTEKNILKVTIKSNDTGETLTQLFTIR